MDIYIFHAWIPTQIVSVYNECNVYVMSGDGHRGGKEYLSALVASS